MPKILNSALRTAFVSMDVKAVPDVEWQRLPHKLMTWATVRPEETADVTLGLIWMRPHPVPSRARQANNSKALSTAAPAAVLSKITQEVAAALHSTA